MKLILFAKRGKKGLFPALELFKKCGNGLLGINKGLDYSGLGLDYTYGVMAAA